MPYEFRRAITAVDGASQEEKQRAREFAKRFGVNFDTRDVKEVVADLQKRGIDAVPFVSPSNNLFKKTEPDWSIPIDDKFGDKGVVPLSGIANKTTVSCNESGTYVTYPSDMYGFNNPQNVWKSTAIEIAALGDSFTQGYCVPPDKNFVAAIRESYPATLNLGIAGDGPLLMLATLKEYVTPVQPKTVLWFYFEGNDLRDLQIHRRLNILARYVEGPFVQNLPERQSKIDQALMNYVDQVRRKAPQDREGSGLNIRHLVEFIKFSGLRARSGLSIDKESEGAVSEANLALFRQILSQAKDHVDTWGGKIYFVYLPDWDRYAQKKSGIYGQQRAEILSYVNNLGIPLIDIHPAFQSQTDPLSLFPFREPNHYNEKGHRIVADEVLKVLRVSDPAGHL
jgi:lysophospholipase L1-like esterase